MIRLRERGQLDTALLAAVEHGPLDGYEVVAAVRETSGGRFAVSEGEVFRALHRLARNRMVGRRRQDPRRYLLTDGGRRSLATRRREWAEFSAGMTALLESAPVR